MNKLTLIKKFKANFIKFKLHKYFGFASDLLIFFGYMLKLSKWADENKPKLLYDDFYNKNVIHKDRLNLYEFLVSEKKLKETEISYLEFGVAQGNSLRWWTQNNVSQNSDFWGFDTFVGLPEKYGSYDVGVFSLEGNYPDIKDDRINFVKGLFQDTLLNTIPKIDFTKKVIIHIDGDLYSSAMYSLSILYQHMKVGDIIIFDEFGVPYHEFKAFDDFVKSFYIKLEPVGAINNYLQMVFEVKEISKKK